MQKINIHYSSILSNNFVDSLYANMPHNIIQGVTRASKFWALLHPIVFSGSRIDIHKRNDVILNNLSGVDLDIFEKQYIESFLNSGILMSIVEEIKRKSYTEDIRIFGNINVYDIKALERLFKGTTVNVQVEPEVDSPVIVRGSNTDSFYRRVFNT